MTAPHALKNARKKWDKVLSRKEAIEIPEFGEPDKPYKAEYRVLTGTIEEKIIESAKTIDAEGQAGLSFIRHNALIIIYSLRQPMTGDMIFNEEEHLEELMELDSKLLARIAAEIREGQKNMRVTADEVKEPSAGETQVPA